jgi:hypothetical protein
MGILSTILAYGIGRRRGRSERAERGVPLIDERDADCINYESFCRNFGNCNGMECEYE